MRPRARSIWRCIRRLPTVRVWALRDYLGVTRDKILLSYIVSTGAPDAVLADVESAYQAGVRVFKVKIGRDIAEESNTYQAYLIDSYPAARFYADANQTLDRGNAAAILDDLFELGVMHCEGSAAGPSAGCAATAAAGLRDADHRR